MLSQLIRGVTTKVHFGPEKSQPSYRTIFNAYKTFGKAHMGLEKLLQGDARLNAQLYEGKSLGSYLSKPLQKIPAEVMNPA